jgi:hypothetical protein
MKIKNLFTIILIAVAAFTMSFTLEETSTPSVQDINVLNSIVIGMEEADNELSVVKYSVTYANTDTYLKITLNNDVTIPLIIPGEKLPSSDLELLIASFTQKQLKAMVEAPECDNGFVQSEDYIGTNFVKLTCAIPMGAQSGVEYHDECKTYNPYTHRWTPMASCSPWNYE